ncbi:retrovirus-related pol polyprotein from transposon TNT 1-94 [Tanacetum coccineum]
MRVPQREKSAEQKYFSNDLRKSDTTEKAVNSKEVFQTQTILLAKRMDEMLPWTEKCKSIVKFEFTNQDIQALNKGIKACLKIIKHRSWIIPVNQDLKGAIEVQLRPVVDNAALDVVKFKQTLKEEMVQELRYFNSLEKEIWFSELEKQCISLELSLQQSQEKIKDGKLWTKHDTPFVSILNNKTFEINDLKAQLHDKDIAMSDFKKLIENTKGKYVDTKFVKPSVARQLNAFKFKKPSVLGKPTPFSDSLEKKDFSESKSITRTNVTQDLTKPITPQFLHKKWTETEVQKNTNVISPGMFRMNTRPTQTRTSQSHQDIRKTNKRVSFSTGVIPTTSVSKPQLKSTQLKDRVMQNNSQVKKTEVEDQRRNFKFSNNKASITACNDSLNAKTSNVNFVYVTCGKYVFNANHDLCVLHYIHGVSSRTKKPIEVPISTREPKRIVNQSVASPYKRTVASESTIQKPRSRLRMLYGTISKTCKWWYMKLIPLGYKWEPKSKIGNVNTNVSLPLGNESRSTNISEPTSVRGSNLSNTPLYGSRRSDHYTIELQESSSPNPIYFKAKASTSQSWLWHPRLSHLNFDTINLLSKKDIVNGLPKLKYVKTIFFLLVSWVKLNVAILNQRLPQAQKDG